jgi:hypothetical protein
MEEGGPFGLVGSCFDFATESLFQLKAALQQLAETNSLGINKLKGSIG